MCQNFETDILPEGAKKENKVVYRVIKYGTINRDIDMDLHGHESSCIIERDKIDWIYRKNAIRGV